ncbi:MAG: hypothetical protein RR614_07820 [Eubacterium sp.]
MIKTILEQIKTAKSLLQLYWYKGYVSACKDNAMITDHEFKQLKDAISERNSELFFES